MWISKPKNALLKYIIPEFNNPKWLEDSSSISDEIGLSKRELFGLINLACIYSFETKCNVGFDINDEEPNDGFITTGRILKGNKQKIDKIRVEHKIIAQMDKREVLKAILETYDKYASKGKSYGENRILIVHPNKGSDHGGLIKISDLTDNIGEDSPFDKVFSLGMIGKSKNKDCIIMHSIQHYPRCKEKGSRFNGVIAIELNFVTGELQCLT
jgi:hypothetical protein